MKADIIYQTTQNTSPTPSNPPSKSSIESQSSRHCPPKPERRRRAFSPCTPSKKFCFQFSGRATSGETRLRSSRKLNIIKKISTHTLRNSFATHLLKEGVSLRYVQVLLEYNSGKTIGIYTHVANTDMNFIKKSFRLKFLK